MLTPEIDLYMTTGCGGGVAKAGVGTVEPFNITGNYHTADHLPTTATSYTVTPGHNVVHASLVYGIMGLLDPTLTLFNNPNPNRKCNYAITCDPLNFILAHYTYA